MEYKDYYDTLGLSKDASADEVQRAYRKLARKYHPDVNKGAEAENKFKEINEAHQVLGDPEKRKKYDRFGSAWQESRQTGGPPPGFEDIFSSFGGDRARGGAGAGFDVGGEGFSSFFEALFGGGGGGGGGGGARWTSWGGPGGGFQGSGGGGGARAGSDQEARLRLTLEEAARGGSREISLGDPRGDGQRKLRVKIPAGVRAGQRIRLGGQGGAGDQGGPRGDLYLKVEILPHQRFRLEGTDLHTSLPITPWEAALGTEAAVPTLDGEVKLKVPAGTSSGRRIRLRGRGFPAKGEKGDLYAEVKIVVPDELGAEERELYERLARTSDFRPRGS